MKRHFAIVATLTVLVGALIATFLMQREEVGAVASERVSPKHAEGAAEVARDESSTTAAVREVVHAPEPAETDVRPAPSPALAVAPGQQGFVDVRVVDAATSIPLPDVSVTLARCPFGHEHAGNYGMHEVVVSGATDANGHARLAAPVGVEVLARVEPPFLGDPAFATPVQGADQELELRADRGVQLTGRVETQDGKPIKDASVSVNEHRPDGSMTFGLAHTRSGADGKYVIAPFRISAGATYGLRVGAIGYATVSRDRVDPFATSTDELPPIVLEASGIPITGTIVGDSLDVAGKRLELHSPGGLPPFNGKQVVELKADGAFEFRVTSATVLHRLEFDGYCLDGNAALMLSLPAGATQYACGIVHASQPSTHYTGRVIRADGVPVTSGSLRLGGFAAEITPNGTFDLALCSPGPLPLVVTWSSGDENSYEHIADYVFPSTSGNEFIVQPRGILIHVTHAGESVAIPNPVVVDFDGPDGLKISMRMPTMRSHFRIGDSFGDSPGTSGPASVTITVDGRPPVTKEFTLGEGGLRCPEVVVTYDSAELGLE